MIGGVGEFFFEKYNTKSRDVFYICVGKMHAADFNARYLSSEFPRDFELEKIGKGDFKRMSKEDQSEFLAIVLFSGVDAGSASAFFSLVEKNNLEPEISNFLQDVLCYGNDLALKNKITTRFKNGIKTQRGGDRIKK
jgi:hypothetical protein